MRKWVQLFTTDGKSFAVQQLVGFTSAEINTFSSNGAGRKYNEHTAAQLVGKMKNSFHAVVCRLNGTDWKAAVAGDLLIRLILCYTQTN